MNMFGMGKRSHEPAFQQPQYEARIQTHLLVFGYIGERANSGNHVTSKSIPVASTPGYWDKERTAAIRSKRMMAVGGRLISPYAVIAIYHGPPDQ